MSLNIDRVVLANYAAGGMAQVQYTLIGNR